MLDEQHTSASTCSTCGCPHHKMIPFFVVIFGALFLLRTLGWVSAYTVDIAWPIVVIAGGFSKLIRGMCGCCGK